MEEPTVKLEVLQIINLEMVMNKNMRKQSEFTVNMAKCVL